jgi:hypothetical protein
MVIISSPALNDRIKQSVAASPDEKAKPLACFQCLLALLQEQFLWDLLTYCNHNPLIGLPGLV